MPPMHRSLSSLTAAVLTIGSTWPALACVTPPEKAAFQVQGVKSELMVVAIDCSAQDRYNAFVTQFRRDLQVGETTLNRYFARTARGHAQTAHDQYITTLANAQMQDGLTQGDQFCVHRMPLFDAVMTLHSTPELAAYANTNAIVQPADLTDCPVKAPKPAKKIKTASQK
jgi:hypothetical protein